MIHPVTLQDLMEVLRWRNMDLRPWRTEHAITTDEQKKYFNEQIATGKTILYRSNHGVVGIENIKYGNRGIVDAELCLVPREQQWGLVSILLGELFTMISADVIWTEIYRDHPGIEHWINAISSSTGYAVRSTEKSVFIEWRGLCE